MAIVCFNLIRPDVLLDRRIELREKNDRNFELRSKIHRSARFTLLIVGNSDLDLYF